MELVTLDKEISHFDGNSPAAFTCKICKMPGHEAIQAEQDLCIPCSRYITIHVIVQKFSIFVLPSMVILVLMLFFNFFSDFSFIVPILVVLVVLPSVLLSGQASKIAYFKIHPLNRITHTLRYITIRDFNALPYYEQALNLTKKHSNEINEKLRDFILYYLVEGVFLGSKAKTQKMITDWAKALEMEENEFVDKLFEKTNIWMGFTYEKGISLLPLLWPYIDEEEIKIKIMDILNDAAKTIDTAPNALRLYFLEDLYLVSEELLAFAEQHNNWEELVKAIEEFEPEEPPKNIFESVRAQAEENQRKLEQQRMLEKSRTNIVDE